MDKSMLLTKRNRLFINLFAVGLLLHTLSSLFIHYQNPVSIPLFAILYCILLYILRRMNINNYVMQTLILGGMNGYILYLIIDTPYYIHILLFVYPLFIASLYHSIISSLILLPITALEVIYLFQKNYINFESTIEFGNLYVVLLFLILISLTAVVHSLFMRNTWHRMEEQQSTLERALDSREGYLHMFFENAKDGIAVFDLDARIIALNPAFELLYGWSREECIGNHIPLVPPENVAAANERIEKVLKGESFYSFETKDMKKNGTFFDAQLTLSPIYNKSGDIVAMSVITRDISYRKEAEKLIVQTEKLKLAGEIAAGVAHEIRNPMTVISGFIQMMNTDDQHPYQTYTKLIASELERINLIISEFLILAKPHVTKAKEFHIERIIQDVVLLFSPELNLRSILLKESWNAQNAIVIGEQNQIKQVIINIVKNAIEALTNEGSLEISTDLETEGFVSIHIRDNGAGMTPEVVNQIFEPFFTTKTTGTGLGMMISEKIIQEHAGKITINSQLNKGTTVSILLPYNKAEKSATSN
ncbi:PAS domain S-box protein [Paenisporosarcina sp. HGH0030]|uniref:ATP-binding protein n=1 Tax=Paenisporosarcina sp. HGH0030 TaxID=1078085 RepID=UPI00034E72A7|nr:ATP-binding protein [Paenisporosarcina sp. HGH0030]EPD52030.1 PAS domain S-box protein [Paenisporosarcina sp. HGH0030]